jgi:hypothetical protein
MPIKRVSIQDLLKPIGNPNGPPGALAIERNLQWDVGIWLQDGQSQNASTFFKSVNRNLDSADKKSSYVMMVTTLFSALEDANYQASLKDTQIQCKPAHSFKYSNSKEHIWELKRGKKDRIYFYQLNKGGPLSKGVIVLCMAYHKKDQQTPPEVSSSCESDVRALLREGHHVRFC